MHAWWRFNDKMTKCSSQPAPAWVKLELDPLRAKIFPWARAIYTWRAWHMLRHHLRRDQKLQQKSERQSVAKARPAKDATVFDATETSIQCEKTGYAKNCVCAIQYLTHKMATLSTERASIDLSDVPC